MPYIEATDYKSQIKDSNLLNMVDNTPAIREEAEDAAIAQVRDYLYERFDTDAIFSATGAQRHAYLLRCVKNIVLYILHQRLPKRILPDHIDRDYQETLNYLERISDGKIAPDLPRLVDDDDEPETKFRWGSSEARSY